MNDSIICSKCGKPAIISLTDGTGTTIGNLCKGCYSRRMALNYENVMPEDIPDTLTFKMGRKSYKFDIELRLSGLGKTLTATEIGMKNRKVDVWGNLEDDVDDMMITLNRRIEELLS